MGDLPNPLEECQDELESVVEENRQLRASANAFADLAERFKASLERERRLNSNSGSSQHQVRKDDDPAY